MGGPDTAKGRGEHAGVLAYRPEIDGLRAIALLAVMAYHAKVPGVAGGYAGVDIFFVISGYLITGIIWRETAAGTFTLRHFYERRARRILPALTLVLIVSALAVLLVPDLEFTQSFGAQLAASVLFAGNIYLWRQPEGYFAAPEDFNPLVHLWSLGVEEQFYILFPLALLLAVRIGRRWTSANLALAFCLSLALCVYLGHRHQGANFYLLPSRAWELLAGAILALQEPALKARLAALPRLRAGLAAIGAALLLIPVFAYDASVVFPGLAAIPTILGACMVIAFAGRTDLVGRVLASRPMVLIGLVSYSTYLWHQPLLAFGRVLAFDHLGLAASLALLAAAFVLGGLSWRYVEAPFRRRGARRGAFWAGAGLALSGGLVALGAAMWSTGGLPQRFTPEVRRLAGTMATEYLDYHVRCLFVPEKPRGLADACRVGAADGPVSVAMLGDSHMIAVASAFEPALKRSGRRALLIARPGCPPMVLAAPLTAERDACSQFQADAIRFIAADPSIRSVVLAARWTYDLEGTGYDNGEGGVEVLSPKPAVQGAEREQVRAGYKRAVALLLAAGKRVVLVYPVPEAGWNVPRSLAKMRLFGGQPGRFTTSHASFVRRNAETYRMLDSIGNLPGLVRLYPASHLCGGQGAGRCMLHRNGEPLYFDDDHLTRLGAGVALPEAAEPGLLGLE